MDQGGHYRPDQPDAAAQHDDRQYPEAGDRNVGQCLEITTLEGGMQE